MHLQIVQDIQLLIGNLQLIQGICNMGKSILIIVFGISLIIGFVILKLNTNATYGVESTMNKFDQTHARLIANSGIEIYLEKLKFDVNRAMLNRWFLNNSLFNGTYDIWISNPKGIDSIITVKAISRFMSDTSHISIAEVQADKIEFKPAKAALYLASQTIGSTKNNPKTTITGNITIDGHDHNHSAPYDSIIGHVLVPGIGVDGVDQKNSVLTMLKDNSSAIVDGFGGVPSVHVVPSDTVEWDEYALELANNPDISIPLPPKSKKLDNWGTAANPLVTFVDGDITIGADDVKSGCGILVVNGSLTVTSNFTFVGLVISFKETLILGGSGTVTIVGSLVGAGNEIKLTNNLGNFNILYSSSALSLVQNLIRTKRFKIISWWE
jgi:hypothetical protein